MNPEQEELHKKTLQAIDLRFRKETDEAKEHLKKFTIKTDVAKQLREALKKSCDEYQPLNDETDQLRKEQRKLEHQLKLLKAKIDINDAKLKFMKLILRDQKYAWMNEVYVQTNDALHGVHSGGNKALKELFGDCFSEDGLRIPDLSD